ncbi:hypothetical protein ACHAWU_009088 [Discostella pseudostelligera]|uniref:fructokinase n=1 Tax=Discostella pseudostelligera TaxID=259834 RepID=A0ABD3MLD6_9STRA
MTSETNTMQHQHPLPYNSNNNDNDENEIYLAAIEGGGTTFVVSIARVVKQQQHEQQHNNNTLLQIGPTSLEILNTATFPPKDEISGVIPTWTPTQILDAVCAFLQEHRPSSPSSITTCATNNDKPLTDDAAATPDTALLSVATSTGRYSAVGIATFGPAGVHRHKPNYGTILAGSPKKEWRNVDILTPIREACGFSNNMSSSSLSSGMDSRVRFDTDVNAPALAEFRHRNYLKQQQQQQQQNNHPSPNAPSKHNSPTTFPPPPTTTPLTSLAYVTIGTGVGVGLIINSQPVHGLLHPEGGHVAICPLEQDTFTGYSWGKERSPYAGVNTVEGVASSVALTERYLQMKMEDNDDDKTKQEKDVIAARHGDDDDANKNNNSSRSNENIDSNNTIDSNNAQTRELLSTLPDSHPVWSHAANAIANLCVSLLLLTSMQKIVLGGGIMKRYALYDMIRQRVWSILNGYLDCVEELSDVQQLDNVIVEGCWVKKNKLGSGLVGAYALALDAYEESK